MTDPNAASLTTPTRVVHAVPGRLRLQVATPRGQGTLHRLADELVHNPNARSVRANHTARSVTITYDADRVSVSDLLGQLQAIGTVALDLADPREWPRILAQEVVPLAEDPSSFPGRLSRELSDVTEGRLDLSRLTALVLASSAVLQLRGALLRGEGVPWLRMLAYLIAAVSLWQRHREAVEGRRSGAGAGRDTAGVRFR